MKKILFVASSLLMASQVQAGSFTACTAADLNGSYVMFQAAVNHHNHNGRCDIVIDQGDVSGTCEFGLNVDNVQQYIGPVYGTAVMNQNCSSDVVIKFKPNPAAPDFEITSNFDLQFTPNKESFVGRFGNQFGTQGITNGTRVSPLLLDSPAN